ncbi:hypothetical protein KR093_002686, partial [Drosophila rubida]
KYSNCRINVGQTLFSLVQIVAMNWIVVSVAYFAALNGMSSYYPQRHRRSLQRSRYLQLYGICHNLLVLLGLPVLLHDLFTQNPNARAQVQSPLIRLINIIFGVFKVLLIVSCVYCANRLQTPIRRMFEKLQSMDKRCWTTAAPRELHVLLFVKLVFVVVHVALQLSFFVSRLASSPAFYLWGSLWRLTTNNMISAASLLAFLLLWQTCRCNLALQSRLEQLLRRRAQPEQVHDLLLQQQQLILIIGDFCGIFDHILFWDLLCTAFTGIQSGYYLIRILFGRRHSHLSLKTAITIASVVFHSLAEFYIVNFLAGVVEDLKERTNCILRRCRPQFESIERTTAWMMLQMSFQSTKIQIFGFGTLNRSLVFNVMAQIVAHTLYMIQHDYEDVM